MKFRTLILPLLAALLCLPAAARAQTDPAPDRRPGMLGFTFDVTRRQGTDIPTQVTVRVEEVMPGSGAARAGLRQGDILVRVNGAAVNDLPGGSLLRVSEGDTVRLRVRRVDGEHDLRIVAGPRPAGQVARGAGERPRIVVRERGQGRDTVNRVIITGPDGAVRERDGEMLRLEVSTGDSASREHRRIVVIDSDTVPHVRGRPSGERTQENRRTIIINGDSMRAGDVLTTVTVDTVAFPVQWLASRIDSLARVVRVDTFIASRLDSITRVLHDSMPMLLERGPAAEVLRNLAPLAGEMIRVGEPTAQSYFMDIGRAAAAGAQLAEMNEGLARYFGGTREGVLVLEVTPRSPANRAGLEAGDIIVGVDGAVSQRPEDVRRALSRDEDGTLVLNVVRQGRRREVTLRWDRQQDFVRVFGPERVQLNLRRPPPPAPPAPPRD